MDGGREALHRRPGRICTRTYQSNVDAAGVSHACLFTRQAAAGQRNCTSRLHGALFPGILPVTDSYLEKDGQGCDAQEGVVMDIEQVDYGLRSTNRSRGNSPRRASSESHHHPAHDTCFARIRDSSAHLVCSAHPVHVSSLPSCPVPPASVLTVVLAGFGRRAKTGTHQDPFFFPPRWPAGKGGW